MSTQHHAGAVVDRAYRTEWARAAVYVGGQWRESVAGHTIDVENPATEAIIGTAADAGVKDAQAAVSSAVATAEAWSTTALPERREVLEQVLSGLERRKDLLVETTVAEIGAPLTIAKEAHIEAGLSVLRAYIEAADEVAWEERVGNSLVLREAIGVAACITPWNYPFYQVLAKIGGALLAGAAVVLKPAELTPLSAYLLTDAIHESALPAGVFNLVPGAGSVVGEALATHPDVDAISFTGSTRVGSRVAALAAASIKRVSLELGGKSASLILPGADLERAVAASVEAATLNSGQTCTAWSRLLVPRADLHTTLQLAAARADALVVGDPTEPETEVGPVASQAQRHTVTGFIERALAGGGRLVAGGAERPTGLPRGHYVRPTVVTDLEPHAEIVHEEVFGPVLTVQPYDSIEEAVTLANGTPYGLAGAVWGPDQQSALTVARRLRTGQVDINGGAFNPAAPFGGYRRSGNGRELGRWGIEEFLETKAIQL